MRTQHAAEGPTVHAQRVAEESGQHAEESAGPQTERAKLFSKDPLYRREVSRHAKRGDPSEVFWAECPEDRAFLISKLVETSTKSIAIVLADIDPNVWFSQEVKAKIRSFLQSGRGSITALVQKDQVERFQAEWASGLNGHADALHFFPMPQDVVHGGVSSNVVVCDERSYGIEENKGARELDVQFGNIQRSKKLHDHVKRLEKLICRT